MSVVRTNVISDAVSYRTYVDGVLALKEEFPAGATNTAVGLPGINQKLSTWDLFVLWHGRADNMEARSGTATIHQGPVFLPWHRWMLLLVEANIARILARPTFALPYWDWSADAVRSPAQQPNSPIFKSNAFGGGTNGPPQGVPVPNGPFSAASGFAVRVADGPNGPRSINRPLTRNLGADAALPGASIVTAILSVVPYDSSPFDSRGATPGMRNRVEGWAPGDGLPHAHNQVHVFVGGDMLFGTSPNDPLFYLHHANIDRIWSSWQHNHTQLPASQRYPTATTVPAGHRLSDALYSALTDHLPSTPVTPKVREMINTQALYRYDTMPA